MTDWDKYTLSGSAPLGEPGDRNKAQDFDALIAEEHRIYACRPRAELRRVKQALEFYPWNNTPAERARLVAVRAILGT